MWTGVLTAVYQITLEHVRIAKCPTTAQRIWASPTQKAEDILYRTNISVWKQWFAMMANVCQGHCISTSLKNQVQLKKDLGFRSCQSVLHGKKGFHFLHRMFLLWKMKYACLHTQKKSTSLDIAIMIFIKQITVYSKVVNILKISLQKQHTCAF